MPTRDFETEEEMDAEFERIEDVNLEHLDLKEGVKDAREELERLEEELKDFEEENKSILLH